MKDKNEIDPKSIYMYGMQFSKICDRIQGSQNLENKSESEKYAIIVDTIIPELVNGSLAIELYLKALIVKEGHSYRNIHKIDSLFEMLNENTKREIKGIFLEGFKSIHKKEYGLCFEKKLKENSNVFVEFRYAYEKANSADYEFIKMLELVMRTYARCEFEKQHTI
ncbi:HEPN domain-containing protein [Clostridium beijerinckii]|uniref:HEPN domain-containing protein n=1 Tax=Clostridium beijerinckii TaxID=1520 RepID=UPI00098CEA5F|nr:HEPN domain-containing protein [Clostridium beijerinckii]MBA8935813.1 hypothetical protein [Clostridium beijerinckii]NRU40207.1 hypothetical protein [Clostridium beijerinckii]NSA96515.1 hypothetical protein [Clostridium beijerinckii]OOM53211.1 hypothetical protein CLOBI_51070 [Clostridium beijerinckii]OOM70332.1 hypothetical protein CLBEIC_19960 [Clostridium beijerinckii]